TGAFLEAPLESVEKAIRPGPMGYALLSHHFGSKMAWSRASPNSIQKQTYSEADVPCNFRLIQLTSGNDEARGTADHQAQEGGRSPLRFGDVDLPLFVVTHEQVTEEVDRWPGTFFKRNVEQVGESIRLSGQNALQLDHYRPRYIRDPQTGN